MSANGVPEAVNGTFALLGALDNPYIAITFLICIAIVLVCIFGMGAMFWISRGDRKDAEIRYDALLTQTRQEFREMHTASINSDRDLDKTIQGLSTNLQTQATLLTALVTMRGGNNGG